jgi:hypothetical protein
MVRFRIVSPQCWLIGAAALVCSTAAEAQIGRGTPQLPRNGSDYPDLVVEKITLGPDCRIMVQLANRGTARLADSAYATATLQIDSDFSRTLEGIDPEKRLAPPGGTVTFTRPTALAGGTRAVTARIDPTGAVAESNEGNNSLSTNVTCTPTPSAPVSTMSDFALSSAGVAPGCRPMVRIKNIGSAVAAETLRRMVLVRTFDGLDGGRIDIDKIDSNRVLATAGGELVYTEPPEFRVYSSYSYSLPSGPGGFGPFDTNTANNSFVHAFAAGSPCVSSPRPPADLQPIDLEVARDLYCNVLVKIRNNGPGSVPPSVLNPQNPLFAEVYVDGTKRGEGRPYMLSSHVVPSGGETLGWAGSGLSSGTFQVRVVLKPHAADSNQANNVVTKMLTCPRP